MKYDLKNLSPKAFEQLIQALVYQTVGAGVVIFGDGPDGAREATYEGRLSLKSSQDSWDGYTVFQAKYRETENSKISDAQWLSSELEKELRKIENRSDIKKPDYYVIVSNAKLSAKTQTGGRAKVESVLERYQENIGYSEFSIWDYDKICVMLDSAADVRTAYAAWINPGDILSRMAESLFGKKTKFAEISRAFLQKEMLADQYANLEHAGHTSDSPTLLSRVFVDLPVSTSPEKSFAERDGESDWFRVVQTVINAGDEKLNVETPQNDVVPNRPDHDTDTIPNGRFVLIGGPGQGKTTVGQYIAQLYRARIISDTQPDNISREVMLALKSIKEQNISENIPLPKSRRFPIRITLNEFADFLDSRDVNHNSIINYITNAIQKRCLENISVSEMKEWLKHYPWVVIFDGLDEVPTSNNRDDVLTAIRDFWVDMAVHRCDVMVLATTRPQGYNKEFSPRYYRHLWLQELDEKTALHYAKRLLDEKHPNDPDRRDKNLSRISQASQESATSRLLRSPLQVTILAALVEQTGKPPRERWLLFREYYRIITNREMERDIPAASIIRDHHTDIDAIHKQVGLLLQIESEFKGRANARISRSRLSEIIERRLQGEGYSGDELENLRDKMLHAAGERLVFLVGLEADEAGFEIRSLQEFMAAEALIDGRERDICRRFERIAPIPSWQNVALFGAGNLFSTKEWMRDFVVGVCEDLNDREQDTAGSRVKAGSSFCLSILEDGMAHSAPKYSKKFFDNACKLLWAGDHTRTTGVAGVFEERFRDILERKLSEALASDDSEVRGCGWFLALGFGLGKSDGVRQVINRYWRFESPADEVQEILNVMRGPVHVPAPIRRFGMQKLASVLPSVSAVDGVLALQLASLGDEEDEASHKETSVLANFGEWLTENGRRRRVQVPLLVGHGSATQTVNLSYMAVDEFMTTDLRKLNPLPDKKGWFVLKKILEACQAADLTELAEIFAQIVNIESQAIRDGFTALRRSKGLPWHLDWLLNQISHYHDPEVFVDCIASGTFGDFSAWREAERRWKENGVVVQDILYEPPSGWEIDDQVARCGAPLTVFHNAEGFHHRGIPQETVNALAESWKQARGPVSRRRILEVSKMFEREFVIIGGATFDEIFLSELLRFAEADSSVSRLIHCVSDIKQFHMNYPDIVNKIADGRRWWADCDIPKRGRSHEKSKLEKYFVDYVKRNGLYSSELSFVSGSRLAEGDFGEISQSIVRDAPSGWVKIHLLQAMVLRGDWNQSQPDEAADLFLEVCGTDDELTFSMLFFEESVAPEENLVELLEAVFHKSGGAISRDLMTDIMQQIISARRSGLQQRDVWEYLNLPLDVWNYIDLKAG